MTEQELTALAEEWRDVGDFATARVYPSRAYQCAIELARGYLALLTERNALLAQIIDDKKLVDAARAIVADYPPNYRKEEMK